MTDHKTQRNKWLLRGLNGARVQYKPQSDGKVLQISLNRDYLMISRQRRGDYKPLLYDNDAILPNKVTRTRKI